MHSVLYRLVIRVKCMIIHSLRHNRKEHHYISTSVYNCKITAIGTIYKIKNQELGLTLYCESCNNVVGYVDNEKIYHLIGALPSES